MVSHTQLLLLTFCLLYTCCQSTAAFPHSGDDDDMEIVMVEEIVHYTDAGATNSSAALLTLDEQNTAEANADNESVMDTADDLIFLAKKPQKHQPQQQEQQQHESTDAPYHQIDLLTSDEEDSLTSAAAAAAASASASASSEHIDGGVPREIELHTELHYGHATPAVTPIDMSDFVALIPAAEVKSIAANYYRNDPDVQRAYAYLSTPNFAALKQHIIATPEMSAFLRYLNNSGLDVLGFFYTVTNLTSPASEMETPDLIAAQPTVDYNEREVTMGNEIAKIQQHTTTATLQSSTSTGTKEQLNGLHGLVDSILNILPQDQILATFFDKLETNEQFSKLVDSLSTPLFARTLNNLQNSVALRNLIFTLHNNGIYITRIVDSLKAYFFLGTF